MTPEHQAIIRSAVELIRLALRARVAGAGTDEVSDAIVEITSDAIPAHVISSLTWLAAELALAEPTEDPEAVLDKLAVKFM